METKVYQPNEIDELFSGNAHLKSVIQKIEDELYSRGHVLCGIKVNGMSLTPEDESRFQFSGRNEIEFLEVATQSVDVLLVESRESVIGYLSQLQQVAVKAADALRSGVVKEANDMIRAIVDGTTWVTEMLNQIRSLDQRYSEIEKEWVEAEADFLRTSKELLMAYERNDWVLVADNLEYEWSNSIDRWLKVLRLLAPETANADNSRG